MRSSLIHGAHLLKAKVGRAAEDDIAAAVHDVRLDEPLVDQAGGDTLDIVQRQLRVSPRKLGMGEKGGQLECGRRRLNGSAWRRLGAGSSRGRHAIDEASDEKAAGHV